MLDMDNILKLTVEEIIVINGLEEVAREAKEDSEIIHKAYNNTFGVGVEKVEVWSDGNNYEYLTHEGIWFVIATGFFWYLFLICMFFSIPQVNILYKIKKKLN